MTSLRQLEDRLRAWQSFHGVAGATRTLAAAQTLHWTELVRRAEAHLARCLTLRDAYAEARVPAAAPCALVGLGSDLGLCGPFNRAVAERFMGERPRNPVARAVVGQRLRIHVDDDVLTLPAPTTFARVETLATELELLLTRAEPTRLVIVLAAGVEADGRPRVAVWDEPDAPPSAATPPAPNVAELVDPGVTAAAVASLTRHARLVAALTRSAASEAEARWRTMNRAYDAADRRIGEQQRELRKRRQELITQEMLEARQGARSR